LCSTEDIAEFHEFLASKKSCKRRYQEDPGPYLPGELVDSGGGSDNGNGNDDTLWIGKMIPPPRGERGRTTNADGRVGFNKGVMLTTAKISEEMWSVYIVS